MTDPLGAWPSRNTSREVISPDGRQWLVDTVRVGVPQPTNYNAGELVGILVGSIYHHLWHRGEWRLEVREVGVSTTWELGVYSREEAEAQAALHVTELEAGRWEPHPRREDVQDDDAVAIQSSAESVELGNPPPRGARIISALLGLGILAPLVLLFAIDDLSVPQVVGLIAAGAIALVAMLRWGSWRAER